MGERGGASLVEEACRFLGFEPEVVGSDLNQVPPNPEPGKPQGRVEPRTHDERERRRGEVNELFDAVVDVGVGDQVVVVDDQRHGLGLGGEVVGQPLDEGSGIGAGPGDRRGHGRLQVR